MAGGVGFSLCNRPAAEMLQVSGRRRPPRRMLIARPARIPWRPGPGPRVNRREFIRSALVLSAAPAAARRLGAQA